MSPGPHSTVGHWQGRGSRISGCLVCTLRWKQRRGQESLVLTSRPFSLEWGGMGREWGCEDNWMAPGNNRVSDIYCRTFQVCQNPPKLRKPTCDMWKDVPVLFFPYKQGEKTWHTGQSSLPTTIRTVQNCSWRFLWSSTFICLYSTRRTGFSRPSEYIQSYSLFYSAMNNKQNLLRKIYLRPRRSLPDNPAKHRCTLTSTITAISNACMARSWGQLLSLEAQ